MYRNEAHGPVNAPLVQVGSIDGDINIQLRPSDQSLRNAMDRATVSLGYGRGVVVADDLVLTCVELVEACGLPAERLGDALALVQIQLGEYPAASLAQGVPTTKHSLLQLSNHVGAPVLNLRTGAVCGVYDGTGVEALPSIPNHLMQASRANHAWLDLLDANQLSEGGWRHPDERLRRYLKAIGAADEDHAYRFLRALAPSLSALYVARKAIRSSEVDEDTDSGLLDRLRADELLHHHLGVQIVDAPGMGKSSLVRRMTADAAQNWLQRGSDNFVPVLLPAVILAFPEPLPNVLAKGAARWFSPGISSQDLVDLFNREPVPGVQWLILVDGVDEIAGRAERQEVLRKIADHRDDERYRFVVTSRPLKHNDIGRIEQANFPTYRIEPFTEAELEEFAARFLAERDEVVGGSAEDFMARVRRTEMRALARIPLISTMLCTLYADQPSAELPQNQSHLYGEFLDWTRTKRNELDVRSKLRESVSGGGPSATRAVDSVMDNLDNLLQYLAYRLQILEEPQEAGSILDDAVSWTESLKPEGLSSPEWADLLSDVLRQSGLLTQVGGNEFEFLHKTVEEYLAARELAARHPNPNRRAARKLLDTRQERPGHRVKIFLAARWVENGADVNRYLRRVLRGRQWKANISFLTGLVQHGLRLSDRRLQRQVERLLCREIRKQTSPALEWTDAVGQLEVLNPDLAMQELAKLANRDRTHEGRCLEALRELIVRQAYGTLDLAEDFLTHSAITRRSRSALVEALSQQHREATATLLAKLADGAGSPAHRVELAQLLLVVDHARGVEQLNAFAAGHEFDEASRVTAVESLLTVAPESHIRILPSLLRELHLPVPWKQTAELLYRHDATGLAGTLTDIAENDHSMPERRYDAALLLFEKFQSGHDLLLESARDRRLDRNLRIEAVTWGGEQNPQVAVNIVLDVLGRSQPHDPFRMKAVEALLPIEPSRAYTELTKLAREDEQCAENRLRAVKLGAGRTTWEKAELCVQIVGARGSFVSRLKAAHLAATYDDSQAERAFRRLVEDPVMSEQERTNTAIESKQYGNAICSNLLTTLTQDESVSPDGRLHATEQLGRYDSGRRQKVLLELVVDNALPQVHRRQAAKRLRNHHKDAVDSLFKIATSRHNNRTRLEAARVLAVLDRSEAVNAFRRIEFDRKTSRHAKQEARSEAEKLDR